MEEININNIKDDSNIISNTQDINDDSDTISNFSTHDHMDMMTREDILKIDLVQRFRYIKALGVKLTQDYDMNSNSKMMQYNEC